MTASVEAAQRLHADGRLAEADRAYAALLATQPNALEALYGRGVVAYQSGRPAAALKWLERVVARQPSAAAAHNTIAAAFQELGRSEEAAVSARRAIAAHPSFAEAHNNLGVALLALGRSEEAIAAFRRAVALREAYPEAHNNLAIAFEELDRLPEALASASRALALAPDYAAALDSLSVVLRRQGKLDEAVAASHRAVGLRGDDANTHNNLALALIEQGKLGEAEAAAQRATTIDERLADAWNTLGNIHQQRGEAGEAAVSFSRAAKLEPDNPKFLSNLLYGMNYDPAITDDALAEAHRTYEERFGALATVHRAPHVNVPAPDRRLRVGYVSPDFGYHPVGYFLDAVFAAHDRAAFEPHCYSGRLREDVMTARFRSQAAGWRSTVGVGDAELCAQIRADAIDILVDLSGHMAGNRLPVFARKPAPVQASWIGYFHTTGLAAMDYALMDRYAVPAGSERHFTERVALLPDGRYCYTPPDDAPPVAPPPALARGHITFGSFNQLAKVTREVVRLWADILRAVPTSRLLIKWRTLGDPGEIRRLHSWFAEAGIDAARLELRGPSPHRELLAQYADMDIALDPFPFSGGLTSCEALWMGVPVITWPQGRPVARQTLQYLDVLGLTELVTDSAERYVAIAAELAGNPARLAAWRAELRTRMSASPLCDGPRFARNLEAAYRRMWHDWCARAARF